MKTLIAVFTVMTIATCFGAAGQEVIGGFIIEMNRKCGPLSGKTPQQMEPEQRAECEGYAGRINNALGLGSPFALSEEFKRERDWLNLKAAIDACGRDNYCREKLGMPPSRTTEEAIKSRRQAMREYCRSHGLPSDCKEASKIPGRTR